MALVQQQGHAHHSACSRLWWLCGGCRPCSSAGLKLFRTHQRMPLKIKRMRRGTPTLTERSCNCVVRVKLVQVYRTG